MSQRGQDKTRLSLALSESWTRGGKWKVPCCRWCGVVGLRKSMTRRRGGAWEIGIEKLGDDALPRAGDMRRDPGGYKKKDSGSGSC